MGGSRQPMRTAFLDYEFNQITNEKVNLVSCVTHDPQTKKTTKFWLHNDLAKQKELRKHLSGFQLIIGYACVAEARSFISLGLDPLKFKWIDLFLEYRMITNHNDRLNWGRQLVDGKVKNTFKPKPKWERSEQDTQMGFKPTHSLAEATFKLTGEIRDTKEKDETRKLIISNPDKFMPKEIQQILKYNASDVEFLPTIFEAIKMEYEELLPDVDWDEYMEDAQWRGRYSAHTANMESRGYPINLSATKNFSRQIPSILADCQRDINEQFIEEFKVDFVVNRLKGQQDDFELPFKWIPKQAKYSWNQKVTREWLTRYCDTDNWMKTDKGALSLSLEAFQRSFDFKHDYPRGNFGAQMVRYLKLKQSLYGFSESDGKRKTFWDSVGPDGRVRPYMNIYGAQSGRSQPAATGFMFLKPAWMRALVQPAPGKFLAGIDYGQQEFFIAGLESGDESMIQAYLSGDPYLYMGKQAGTIPQDGTKKTHGRERDLMKSTTLGILFGMTKYGLAAKLTVDSGEEYTEEQAQDLIEMFESVYPRYIEWRAEMLDLYISGHAFRTLDGWCLWTDNDNPRSVLNVPVQGGGASIMRKAVDIAEQLGAKVIFTLHDAIYIEGDVGKESDILKLKQAMTEGFAHFYEGGAYEEVAKKIKLDPKIWGPDYQRDSKIEVGGWEIPASDLHIDGRSINDYDRFSKFFEGSEGDLL